jgi:serine acetyltransferase
MRKLKALPIFIFLLIQLTAAGITIYFLTLIQFDINYLCSIFIFILINIIFYRIFMFLFAIPEGDILVESKEELIWMIYTCFWLTYFFPLKNINIVPVYLSPISNRLLGGKMHLNSFSAGLLLDPHLIIIGEGSFIGNRAILIPHYQEGIKLGHKKITIGKNVTVGANSVILPGTTIDDNAIIGAMSLVAKNSHIRTGEVWAGVPARKIK